MTHIMINELHKPRGSRQLCTISRDVFLNAFGHSPASRDPGLPAKKNGYGPDEYKDSVQFSASYFAKIAIFFMQMSIFG